MTDPSDVVESDEGWRSAIADLTVEWVDPTDLLAHPLNARRHPGSQRDALRESLGRVGWVDIVKVNRRTGHVVDGHARIEEAISAGAPVPVLYLDMDEEDERYVLATLDPIGALASYDADVLGQLKESIQIESAGVLAFLADPPLAHVAGDDVPTDPVAQDADPDGDDITPPAAPVTQPGDIWRLGVHRLLCGDCRDTEQVERLLVGTTVHLAVTSPPYADRRKYDEASPFRPVPPDEYVGWFAPVAALVADYLADDGSWVVNIKAGADGLDRELYVVDLIAAHVREWGWHFADEFCWERNGVPKAPVLRLKGQFEPVYQFTRGRWKFRPDHVRHASNDAIVPFGPGRGNTSWADPDSAVVTQGGKGDMFEGQRARKRKNRRGAGATDEAQGSGRNDVGEFKIEGLAYPGNRLPTFAGTHEATGHTAAYPVGLPGFFVQLLTDPGDNVYDPFLGSGSTLLAADQHGRVCYGAEISPAYCDVICRRFQTHTGIRPERDGVPHDFGGNP